MAKTSETAPETTTKRVRRAMKHEFRLEASPDGENNFVPFEHPLSGNHCLFNTINDAKLAKELMLAHAKGLAKYRWRVMEIISEIKPGEDGIAI